MKREELFERISPPRGGLADLRARMGARKRIPLWMPIAAGFTVVCAVLFFGSTKNSAPDLVLRASQHDDVAEISLGLAKPPEAAVGLNADDRSTAIARVQTSRADVAFYWVARPSP